MKHGTLPDSDSLENDYRTMLTTPINLEDVSSFSPGRQKRSVIVTLLIILE